MEKLLKRPKSKRDMGWAHDVCTVGRSLHVDVWDEWWEDDYVEGTVLDLLKRAVTGLEQLSASEKNARRRCTIQEYSVNDKMRIKNITDNYLQGKLSEFPPDSTLSEIRALAS
jgi:hypothetical protein